MKKSQGPPSDLSRWAKGVWSELTAINEFAPHELVTFKRALGWWTWRMRP
jgi:hypothetical protein